MRFEQFGLRSVRSGVGQIAALSFLIGSTGFAFALSMEAAIENCRMTVGRPIVMACMQSGGGTLESCRARAKPRVQACVKTTMNAANGRANVAVAAPTEAAPKISAGTGLPAGFVAPPRTITDITAILDSEKPDLKVIQELQATADAAPIGKQAREDLAQFYFDRGNARAQLGRLASPSRMRAKPSRSDAELSVSI